MSAELNEAQKQLLAEKCFAHVATVGADGSPQVTPVWVEFDGTHVVFNTEKKRAKVRNLEREPRVSLSVMDPANPYRYVEIRGRVVAITAEGGQESIDRLAQKYIGKEYPWNQPGDVRMVVRVLPEKVLGLG